MDIKSLIAVEDVLTSELESVKTFKSLVKLSISSICKNTIYQRNKKFCVKLLPLVENFISSYFAAV